MVRERCRRRRRLGCWLAVPEIHKHLLQTQAPMHKPNPNTQHPTDILPPTSLPPKQPPLLKPCAHTHTCSLGAQVIVQPVNVCLIGDRQGAEHLLVQAGSQACAGVPQREQEAQLCDVVEGQPAQHKVDGPLGDDEGGEHDPVLGPVLDVTGAFLLNRLCRVGCVGVGVYACERSPSRSWVCAGAEPTTSQQTLAW